MKERMKARALCSGLTRLREACLAPGVADYLATLQKRSLQKRKDNKKWPMPQTAFRRQKKKVRLVVFC